MEQPGGADSSDTTRPSAREKKLFRAHVRDLRSRRPAAERTAFAERLAAWIPPEGARRVSCFVGVGTEPDTGPLIAALGDRGIEVLLPITLTDFSLDWALYTDDQDLADARYGLKEPTGPRLGAAALADVDLALVPALAVDTEGRRLGQGAGCYDRALLHVPAQTPIFAVVFDDERLTESLPEEPHDRRVDGVVP
jgi:5-formyltetrahydrofolate cyclo-ligase